MNIKTLFTERAINTSAFARNIGVNKTTIYNIVSGYSDIDNVGVSTFRKIAHGLGMSSDDLYDLLHGEVENG